MSEKRFTYVNLLEVEMIFDEETERGYYFNGENCTTDDVKDLLQLLNEQQATITALKERLYDFEKRKIIEESEIDEDVIPKVKLLRTELFGEKYE